MSPHMAITIVRSETKKPRKCQSNSQHNAGCVRFTTIVKGPILVYNAELVFRTFQLASAGMYIASPEDDEEFREAGQVKWFVYSFYIAMMGFFITAVVVLSSIAMQV